MLIGLWAGADLGARATPCISEAALSPLVVGFVATTAMAMAAKAIT